MQNKKILLIGPLPDPITGESLANQTILDNIEKYSQYKIDSINMSYDRIEDHGKLSFAKVFFYIKLYKNILKIFNADIIYITPGQTFFGVVKYAPFILLAKITGKKIIAHIHGNHLHHEYEVSSLFKRRIMYGILSCVSKGIVLSESLIHNMSPFVQKQNVHILKNFVEDALFPENNAVIEKDTKDLRILYLSNLMPEKGIFDLLEALLILQKKQIKFTAQIAGAIDPANQSQIQKMLDRLGSNVEYLGVVKGAAKKAAFIHSNVFVFPTYYRIEGQPIAILEAMATGNIILTTKHAGIPDIFEEGANGYYINKKDPADIAEKLIQFSKNLSSHQNVMRTNQKIAAEKYRVETFIRNFINILES